MRILDGLDVVNLPPVIRSQATNHLGRLVLAENLRTLHLVRERAEGFVEGLEAACVLNHATVQAMYLAINHVACDRLKELARC